MDIFKSGAAMAHFSGLTTSLKDNFDLGIGRVSGDVCIHIPDYVGLAVLMRSGDDLICSDNFGKEISGFDGKDTIKGNGGNDRLVGGAGQDRYFGGDGRDVVSL